MGERAVIDSRAATCGSGADAANRSARAEQALALWEQWFEEDGYPLVVTENEDDDGLKWKYLTCFFCKAPAPVHAPGCIYEQACVLVDGKESE